MLIRIPQTCEDRRQQTYVQLVLRVYPERTINPFEGRLLRCGSKVEEAALRPSGEYPETPLLIEFAGSDRSGKGHNRSSDVHVLWKFDRGGAAWIELARVKSRGAEWIEYLKPIVIRELGRTQLSSADVAWNASQRILVALDRELELLQRAARAETMVFLYDAFAARLVAAQS